MITHYTITIIISNIILLLWKVKTASNTDQYISSEKLVKFRKTVFTAFKKLLSLFSDVSDRLILKAS